ncbi:hypothetical protein DICPUDRAFT_148745 [Dictyostelium purpureum]|uniref:Nucleosome assembly protein n=1 Tax=Dictyostelium purpureum TaxID=5786 RepID=F0ZBW3_DICPU|nr:uncharacterized protein DICPUDRAFT_148745 [Dictyostelium purpureum]EGC38530.1 hypothetical protein DICPUDRAFT_148745 [Dictyostelium purpureum]|eukprot:XP_003284901.1 hypothetical protein DICPUDRAFT_148745 [Dictyostelium purpureum]
MKANKKQVKVINESEQSAQSKSEASQIPKDIQEKLDTINEKIREIYEQNKKKMLAIEHKYTEQMAAQFKKRSELLSKTKDFEGFWSSILTQSMINNFADNDQAVVDCLVNMEVENKVDVEAETTSKKITFYFKDNSIFKNKQISKENVIDKNGEVKVNVTKIEYYDNNTNKTENKNDKNKKRKQNFSESSFILSWLESEEPDVETLDEFSKLYEDPFSVLLEEDVENDDDEDDDDFNSEDYDAEEDAEEEDDE